MLILGLLDIPSTEEIHSEAPFDLKIPEHSLVYFLLVQKEAVLYTGPLHVMLEFVKCFPFTKLSPSATQVMEF